MRNALIALLAFAAAAAVSAQTVAYNGRLGDKALLVIDGQPRTVAIGASTGGVRLLSLDEDGALVEFGGQRKMLRLGGTQANLGGAPAGSDSDSGNGRIVVTADTLGHFSPRGAINGRVTTFLVDTGASSVAMSRGEAERLGVDWKKGGGGVTSPPHGRVEMHVVTLAQVRVGDVTVYEVPAVVLPAAMPYVLLGNTFLNRFQMRRDNDVLTLDRRY